MDPCSNVLLAIRSHRRASTIKTMSAADPSMEFGGSPAVPRFLVELPSRPRVFFGNLGAVVLSRRRVFTALDLQSTPGEFWPDVFVGRRLPWGRFVQSVFFHVIAGALLIGLTQFFALQPRVVTQPTFDHTQVIYYTPSDYLPPLDTRDPLPTQPAKADPEFSRQPIISVPQEASNRTQTVVSPPKVKLARDSALPNMVGWANEKQPRLLIPDAPLTPASEVNRMAPRMEAAVVSPPPDAAQMNQRRSAPALQNSVVAPPPELRASSVQANYPGLQPDLIAPPPEVQTTAARQLGTMDIAPSAVIAPAPKLPIAGQRTAPGGRLVGTGAAIVPPPPSVSASGSAGASGVQGRVVALSLHPAVSAPPETPAGNRRGTFAATPEGHAGASGSPGSVGSGTATRINGRGTSSSKSDLPSGLYVGKVAEPPSAVVSNTAPNGPADTVNPNLLARARPPRLMTTSPSPSGSAAKLSEAEKTVFAGRKYYSLTLNMPNLNSAGGSWIVRFAELRRASDSGDSTPLAPDISQPMATRKVDPAYPIQLMRENVGGTVILYGVIHSDGHVSDVRVLQGVDNRLDRYAIEALIQWKFQPAMKNGAPVAVEATFQIPFRPARLGSSF